MKNIAEKLREARLKLGFSQDFVAQSLGVSRTVITQIELGNRKITSDEIVGLCKLYHLSADYILNTDNIETNQSVFARGFNELDDKDQQEILNLIAFKKAMAKKKAKRKIDQENIWQ